MDLAVGRRVERERLLEPRRGGRDGGRGGVRQRQHASVRLEGIGATLDEVVDLTQSCEREAGQEVRLDEVEAQQALQAGQRLLLTLGREVQVRLVIARLRLRKIGEAREQRVDVGCVATHRDVEQGALPALLACVDVGHLDEPRSAVEQLLEDRDLVDGRGDAYCGMLSASYGIGLRRLEPHIPEYPVGDPADVARMLGEFVPVARVVEGVRHLKIFSFGPRPFDFLTCHAPIQPLFDLGVEIMENSELDLYDIVQTERGSAEARRIAGQMTEELGAGNTYPELPEKLAALEAALEKFMEAHLGASCYAAFANKCWPAFEKYFGHVPCYVNGRLAAKGIPVACEADIYGALSEYMVLAATGAPPAILDINNSVPKDMYGAPDPAFGDYDLTDLWMGFHCGNASPQCMVQPELKYQLIMHRTLEPGKDPDITRGTLEGRIHPGPISVFRIQSSSDACLQAYVANGEVLDVNPRSFGSIGVFAVREMGRFYRHVLIEKRFPHHTAIAFGHAGKTLFAACRMLGLEDVFYNRPRGVPYPTENPF